MELKNVIRDRIGNVKAEDLLFALGLERRRGGGQRLLETIGLIGAGLVVGAGVALLFAPQSGRDTRRVIGERASGLRESILERAGTIAERRRNGHTETVT